MVGQLDICLTCSEPNTLNACLLACSRLDAVELTPATQAYHFQTADAASVFPVGGGSLVSSETERLVCSVVLGQPGIRRVPTHACLLCCRGPY
jgi:hypothetical protein